jgi:hypothetical protein
MACLKEQEGKYRRGAEPVVIAQVLSVAYDAYREAAANRSTEEKRSYRPRAREDMARLFMLWDSGLFTMVSMEEITGVRRKTLANWLKGRPRVGLPRGSIRPAHLDLVVQTLRHLDAYSAEDLEKLVADMADQGSSPRLLSLLLMDKEGTVRGTRRRAVQPAPAGSDEPGHPGPSAPQRPAGGEAAADDGPAGGDGEPEAADAGVVQGPAPRRSAPVHWAAPIETGGTDHDVLGLETRDGLPADLEVKETFKEGWDPYDVGEFGFDPTGDAYVEGRLDPRGGGGVPGLPAPGEEWPQIKPPWNDEA